jgi:hypothetical protein
MRRKIYVLKEYCKSFDSGRRKNFYNKIQYSVVLPCIIRESEEEVNQIIMLYKRKDKTADQ